jgi:hydroxymethylglutaryl-CoA reductase
MEPDLKKPEQEKFYNLTPAERLTRVTAHTSLTPEEIPTLNGTGGLTITQANHMIENVIGTFALPMGVAQHFLINGREVPVPMVIEEPSVVAGASFAAKLARAGGGFIAHTTSAEMIGQIQVLNIAEPHTSRLKILEQKGKLLADVENIDPPLKRLGGGPLDLEVRILEHAETGPFLVVHLIYDVRDAMGANSVNTAVERIAPQIEAITGGKARVCVLTNLADRRLARARCTIPAASLAFGSYSAEEVRDGIIAASAFAEVDPYRAATHNKGIFNGVDAVVIATGNDWRAVEAGAHAYAARSGRYTSLSNWAKDGNGNLVGSLEMPLAVGIVGGATRVHPTAKAVLKLMDVTSASQLAEIIVSVGLAQNLAALRALATEGIQHGHMALHARQVAIAAGASGEQIDRLADQLVAEKTVRIDRAEEIMQIWSLKK